MKRAIPLFLLLCTAPAAAQQTVSTASANPAFAVETAKYMWELMTNYLTKAAEQVPEADYSFRPTPDVRTFGQMVGHVAAAQNMICASALAEKSANEDDIEKSTTTKAGLLAALRASTEYCRRAYAQSDAASAGATTLFGRPSTRLRALILNATHNSEHYGNLVTYMRIKGMVPPSSQPAPPRM
jgi:uncharacterized damage-inducible protein DinB